jgi:two-component system chemotaxis response regulator CheB
MDSGSIGKLARSLGKFPVSAVVVGTSAGGHDALASLFGTLPANFAPSIIVVQHLHPKSDDFLARWLSSCGPIPVSEATDGMMLRPGHGYVATAGYHLLIETDGKSLSLSSDPPVKFARPAIDVLFDSAADAYGPRVVGVIMTGASSDGAAGLAKIARCGGFTMAQDPAEAPHSIMPASAIASVGQPDFVGTVAAIARELAKLTHPEAPR